MSAWTGVAVAGTLGGYGLVSRRLSRTIVSGPMVFVAVGLALGPLGLGLITPGKDTEPIKVLFEATLALVLFTDALSVQSKNLRRDNFLPTRLLSVGLPLTIAAGWLFAWILLPGLNVWEMALLGAILAPTDAALGQPAISNPGVPPRRSVRGSMSRAVSTTGCRCRSSCCSLLPPAATNRRRGSPRCSSERSCSAPR